jgi:hypothetical protein
VPERRDPHELVENVRRFLDSPAPRAFRLEYLRHAGDPTGPLPTVPEPTFESLVPGHLEEVAARAVAYKEQRIREAFAAQGVDPDIVDDIARRAAAGEFDMPIEVRISE